MSHMAPTQHTAMRLPPRTRAFLDALARYLDANNPSRANAVDHLARHYTPPADLTPLALQVRSAFRDLIHNQEGRPPTDPL